MVRVKQLPNSYPTKKPKYTGISKKFFSKHARKLRASLAQSALAGVHKGKRVVVLKQLTNMLLLVTGPYKVIGCPLRRENQRYLLATSNSLDMSGVKVPNIVDVKYFQRVKAEYPKKDRDIFDNKKEAYTASDQKKVDHVTVDIQVLEAIKKHPEGAVIKQYMKAPFTLNKGELPHLVEF